MEPVELRRALDELALGGAPWPALLARVAMATGRHVRLIAADGALLVDAPAPERAGAAPPPASAPQPDRFDAPRRAVVAPEDLDRVFMSAQPVDLVCTDGLEMRALPVAAGERRVGALAIARPAVDLDDHLRAATTAVAIEAVRRDARQAAVAESAGWLVDELRFGSSRPPDDLDRVARRYGIRLDQPHAAVALEYDGPDVHTWATSLTWIESAVRADGPRAWSVVGGDSEREVAWMQQRLQAFVRGEVRVATGPVVTGASNTRQSFELADRVLDVVRQRHDPVVVTFEQLGLTGLLLTVPAVQLAAFVERTLGPLLDRPDLLATLEAWYASGGSRAAVADAVSIHRNSVGHRLDRIRALLGTDPDAAAVAGDLRAALAGRHVLRAQQSGRPRPAGHDAGDPAGS